MKKQEYSGFSPCPGLCRLWRGHSGGDI